jgi:AsmA protein
MRKLLVATAVLVVLIIAAAITIPFVVPVGAYQARLIALVKQATGRELRIAGPVKLSLLPELVVEANDVSFGNAPGASTPQMVQLRRLRVQLQLWPLLHGAVVVNRLILLEPVIALEVDKAGHPNWAFGPAAAPAAPSGGGGAEPAKTGGGLRISGVALGKVRLIDGRISYIDQRSGRAEQLDSVNITLPLRSLTSPLAAGGSAVWQGEKVTLALDIDQPQAFLNEAGSRIDIKLAAAPLALSFSGQVAGLPPAKLAGAIDLETKSVRQLAKWAGSSITSSGGGLGPLAIRGTLAMAGTKISLTDADFSLDAIKAEGSVSMDSAGVRPLVTGKLAVDRLDLNPYLSPQTVPAGRPTAADSHSAPSPAIESGRSDRPFDGSVLTIADVDFDLEVASIAYRRFETGAAAVGLHVKDSRLIADLRRMALYRGDGRGQVTMDANGAVPSVGLDVALTGVQIDPLAQAAVDNNRLTGTANLDIAVTASGRSQRDLISTLSGRGSLSLVNGQIRGVNLLALAESVAKIYRDLIGTLDVAGALNLLAHGQIKGINPLALAEDAAKGLVGGGNTTNFGTLTATSTITNGVVHNSDLRLNSGSVPMTGAGTVDLRTHAIGYKLSLQLPENVTVPIEVSGTWDDPTYRPDLAAMLAQTPANALAILKSTGGSVGRNLEGIGEGLKGIGQGAAGALKGLLGK